MLHHVFHAAGIAGRSPSNPHTQLNEGGIVDQAFFDQLVYEPQLAGIKDFEFWFDAKFLNALGARAKHVGGRDINQ